MNKITFLSIILLGLYMKTAAQIITTIAGTPYTPGFSGDGGPATQAQLQGPSSIVFDRNQNLYMADIGNNRIRKITPAGIISTIAGVTGTQGFAGDGGPALQAVFNGPSGLAIDSAGNLYVSDFLNDRIRRIDAQTGIITTIAGTGTAGYSGDGGPATAAQIFAVHKLTLDRHGNLYFAEEGNHRVRRIDAQTGIITTVAGSGTAGYNGDSISAVAAQLNRPTCVVVDSLGNLFIADRYNHLIRKVTPQGMIYKVAGTLPPIPVGVTGDGGPAQDAYFRNPGGLAMDRYGRLYIGDAGHRRVRMVDTNGIVSTIAGNGQQGHSGDGGPASQAKLDIINDIALDSNGRLYIADYWAVVIRKVGAGGTSVSQKPLLQHHQLSLAPNPATAHCRVSFHFDAPGTQRSLQLLDMTGRLVAQMQPQAAEGIWQLPLDGLSQGIYMVVMHQDGRVVKQERLSVIN